MTNWTEVFDYDAQKGILIWKPRPKESFVNKKAWSAFQKRSGKIAGHEHYQGIRRHAVMVGHNKRRVYAHRIIWEMHFGSIAYHLEVDHIDLNPFNNRLDNLRLATHSENNRNKGIQCNNSTGVKGVYLHKPGIYRSEIKTNKKRVHLGLFASAEEAASAYAKASERYHGSFGRTS